MSNLRPDGPWWFQLRSLLPSGFTKHGSLGVRQSKTQTHIEVFRRFRSPCQFRTVSVCLFGKAQQKELRSGDRAASQVREVDVSPCQRDKQTFARSTCFWVMRIKA